MATIAQNPKAEFNGSRLTRLQRTARHRSAFRPQGPDTDPDGPAAPALWSGQGWFEDLSIESRRHEQRMGRAA